MKKTKILTAVTVSDSAVLIRGQMAFLKAAGYDAVLCSGTGVEMDELVRTEKPVFHAIEMAREPSPLRDLISLWTVLRCIRAERPDIVNAGTPKAGFLFILAAWILRIRHRVYHVRGFRHESMQGLTRRLQMQIERLTGAMATNIICLTPSVRDMGVEDGLLAAGKCVVLGPGSSGIELQRYNPDLFPSDIRQSLRQKLGISPDALVLGYVGRLVPRKGISELIAAWQALREQYPSAILLLVGPTEDAQPLDSETLAHIDADPRIVTTGKVLNVAEYYSIMDVFTLPAHWEGFGNVAVEAAAMGVPVVTTTGTGTRDAAKDGYNALLVPVKDAAALELAIARYFDDPALRIEHGENGRNWAAGFSRQANFEFLHAFYQSLRSA